MLHLPDEFTLFDQQWLIRPAEPGEIGTDLGQCRPDQLEILINTSQNEESMIHTIWHELCHACEFKLQLELTERQVDLMALAIIHLLRSNSHLLELIIDRDTSRPLAD